MEIDWQRQVEPIRERSDEILLSQTTDVPRILE
jgi:hypothetical protein